MRLWNILRSDGLRSACFIAERGIGDDDDDDTGDGIEEDGAKVGEGASIEPLGAAQFEYGDDDEDDAALLPP